ncbi:N-acetylmuramoyl-L-alanine amidase [Clostridium formicaceticum]|uniref:N-acetylmuramoyl-L-alanine amidase n=1 Tax=Clostridium formicaceticum TaxID=1497 RepID=A0AAC9RLA4_9CLOT|nr:N-acetylmuramoyl-L-alanine amidase [Clostridium formicaceticum]AOY76929.1 hypothetical protein BJL90_14325 [Clostridium formicaceticum]ARE87408.1 N-acetylmuramoyl-L-alanine amidase [Clostridium formicaceticum]
MIKILLSAGHGAGNIHNRGGLYFNEGDNNYYYSLILKTELEKYNNVVVNLVRKNINDNPQINDRSKMGEGYDLYFSIHSNAAGSTVRGTEVWDSVETPNKTLAQAICDATADLFNHNNRGVKHREGQPGFNYYGELRFNKAKSAMIVENGFHTNHDDCLFFKNNHELIAKAQAEVIAKHYKLDKRKIEDEISSWAKDAQQWVIENRVSDGTNPKSNVTREQLWQMLYNYHRRVNGNG